MVTLDIARMFGIKRRDLLDFSDLIYIQTDDKTELLKGLSKKYYLAVPSVFAVKSISFDENGNVVTTIEPIILTTNYDGKDKIKMTYG
jgi:hypothetical protein